MNGKPLVSVVMAVFNGEKYLRAAIDSILRQTMGNLELIIVDDGSTDRSQSITRSYRDARIRIIENGRNIGLAASLNKGIDAARGAFIARMDCDDIALPQRFERQLQWLDQTGADICGSWIKLFGASYTYILKHSQTDEAIKMELLFGAPFAHPAVMMKTELVKQLRYDKAWDKCEDYDLWERAARAGWKMSNVPEVLLLYRQHEAQISTRTSNLQQALAQKIRRRYWEFVFESRGINCKWIDEVLKIREPSPLKPNMVDVDAAFTALLQNSQGEARETIFDHATRLYFRAAASCPDVVVGWSKLNKKFGVGYAIGVKLKLWLLATLHIRPDSRLFNYLKTIYFRLIRSI